MVTNGMVKTRFFSLGSVWMESGLYGNEWICERPSTVTNSKSVADTTINGYVSVASTGTFG